MNIDSTFKTAMLSANNGEQDPSKINPKGEEAASEFEALLIRKVVSSMRKMVPEGGLGMSGKQMHDYLVEESLTQALKDGGGMGMKRLFENNVSPQAPKNRGLVPSIPGVMHQASQIAESQPESAYSLGDMLPPVNDPWMEGPNAEQELMRLMMGSNADGYTNHQAPYGERANNQSSNGTNDPRPEGRSESPEELTGILRGGE